MFFVNAALNDISIGTAGLVALLGYAVVFIGLIALMAVVLVMGKIMVAKKAKTAAAAPAPAAPAAAPAPKAAPAPAAAPKAAAGAAGAVAVKAPMPGNILDVKVKAGASVKAGDVLVILEAMKMENEIVAPQDGTVASIIANKLGKPLNTLRFKSMKEVI